MGEPADAKEAASAVAALTAALRCAVYGDEEVLPYAGPATAEDRLALARLAAAVSRASDELLWCRDAALDLARRGEHPVHWGDLTAAGAGPDSTLIGRWQRWTYREGLATR